MHPPLHRSHPKCTDIVDLLVACHEENKWGKFIGQCNDIKAELDYCFRVEKEEKRKANFKKARDFDDRFDAFLQSVKEKEKEK